MARPGRFELPTPGSVDQCSIQLSYGRIPAKGRGENGRNILGRLVVSTMTSAPLRIRRRSSIFSRHRAPLDGRRKTRANYEKSAPSWPYDDPATTPRWHEMACGETQTPKIAHDPKVACLLLNREHCQRCYLFLLIPYSSASRQRARRQHDSLGCLSCCPSTDDEVFPDLPSGTAPETIALDSLWLPLNFRSLYIDSDGTVELVRGASAVNPG